MDLNADIGSLLKGVFSRNKSDSDPSSGNAPNPHLNQIICGVIVVAFIAAYLYLFYLPEQKRIRQMQAMIDSTYQIQDEIINLDREISAAQSALDDGNARYEELNRLFHNKQELEDLYRNISLLALTYELLVAKLEKGTEKPVFAEKPPISQGEGLPEKREVAFYQIEVHFEFLGDYMNYTLFRRDLAQQKKIINIEKERITVRAGGSEAEPDGMVNIVTTLSTFRFPNSDAEKFLTGS